MSREDLKPELSMEQQFERWLKTARTWIAQRATVFLLGAVAVVIVVFALAQSKRVGENPAQNPNLVPCPDCGRFVSRLAPNCPQCGRPLTPQDDS